MFIGLSGDAGEGAVDWSAGAKVTWDQGGWIKTSGPAVFASSGTLVGTLSGDLSVNMRSSGPSFEGNVSATTLDFTRSVSFGGKF
jgi:hypothetical protein